jgi:hypothetical protein
VRTPGATNLVGAKFNQSYASAVDANSIDHGAARAAFDLRHIVALHNDQAALAVRASGDFVRDDQVTLLVLLHIG